MANIGFAKGLCIIRNDSVFLHATFHTQTVSHKLETK